MIPNKMYNSLFVSDLSLTSHTFYDINQKIKGSMIDLPSKFEESFTLQRTLLVDNKLFNREFNDKRIEIQTSCKSYSQWEIRYGFLSTIKESMVHKVAEEGLEVRLCPYNYFGYNISGIHISQNADVCMNEASKKVEPGDEIILIIFKYMVGRHNIVPMYTPNVLLAPTPNFDSHVCEDLPDPEDPVSTQYIKSLVYLYEFENSNFDPVIRPRHCCPVSAFVYKKSLNGPTIDLTVQEPVQSCISIYEDNPVSFLKPVPQSRWGREFLLPTTTSIVIQRNDQDDSRKISISEYDGSIDSRIERWEPIGREFSNQDLEGEIDAVDRSVRCRSRSLKTSQKSDMVTYPERDRSFDRLHHWRPIVATTAAGPTDIIRSNYDNDSRDYGYDSRDYVASTGKPRSLPMVVDHNVQQYGVSVYGNGGIRDRGVTIYDGTDSFHGVSQYGVAGAGTAGHRNWFR